MSCTLIAITDFAKTPPPPPPPLEARDGGEPPLRPDPPTLRPPPGDNGGNDVRRPTPPARRRGFLETGVDVTFNDVEGGQSCAAKRVTERFVDSCGNVHIVISYAAGDIGNCPLPVPPSIPFGCR